MKQKLIGIAIVFFALVITVAMVKIGKKTPKAATAKPLPSVQTVMITPGTEQAMIKATAIIEANQTLNLASEIPGRVVWVSPKVNAGGVVKKGEVLVRLDSRDHKLQVKQTQVQLESAQLEIDMEAARSEVAKEEWESLGDGSEASDLVLRVRQKEVARLNLISAQSAHEKAKLALSRTAIRAPFSATITAKSVAVGQVVSTQVVLMKMVERGDLLAEVSLPVADLTWINLPVDKENPTEVLVTQELGGDQRIVREGVVESLIGAIDEQTRRARLLIRIPYEKTEETPLLPGAFVEVTLWGKVVDSALKLPRDAVKSGKYVWEVASDSTLNRIELNRLWGTEEEYISGTDRAEAVRIALTLPQAPVQGMKVSPLGGDNE